METVCEEPKEPIEETRENASEQELSFPALLPARLYGPGTLLRLCHLMPG